MLATVSSEEVVSDISDAEQLVAQHQEQQSEVSAREKSVHDFQETAKKLINSRHPQSKDIKDKSKRLLDGWENLLILFKKKEAHLDQVKEVQKFKQEADQLEGWLNARDADILSQDVGDSLEAVEALLKKQEELENILLAKGEHFQGLTKLTNQEMESEKQRKEKDKEMQKQQEMKRKEDERPARNNELQDNVHQKPLIKPRPTVKPKPEFQEQRQHINNISQEMIDSQRIVNNKAVPEKHSPFEQHNKHKPFEERIKKTKKHINVEAEIQPQTSPEQLLESSFESFPIENRDNKVEGLLRIKQELDVGGRKAASRAWKTFFTAFEDGKLLFYRDKSAASSSDPAASLDLQDCKVEKAAVRKNTFRLFVQDGSEFLFTAKDSDDFIRWISTIKAWNEPKPSTEKSERVTSTQAKSEKSENFPKSQIKLSSENDKIQTKNQWKISTDNRDKPNPVTENSQLTTGANNGPGNNVRLTTPVITVTSFDSDDSDVDLPVINSPPPDIPPPVLPDHIHEINSQSDTEQKEYQQQNEDYHNGHKVSEATVDYDDDIDDYILSEEDIHPEFYPDAPTDFNDNSVPDVPSIPPPELPPDEFRDFDEDMVDYDDDDDMMVYPKAPPPPSQIKTPVSTSDQERCVSSSGDGLPSPTLIKPTQKINTTHGFLPHMKKRAPPPPRDKDPSVRYRSDSQDSRGSDDFVPPRNPSSRPSHTKGVHEDKKHDKKKGMFGFLKKKK